MEMRYEDENIWLTQKMMAELYDVSVQNIGQHIKKILEDGELVEEAVIKKYFITATDGKQYSTKNYNLQMIIAVGFKVNNDRAVRFRKWSGQIVKDYTIQGWTMDKERLKKGHMFTDEYFERQLQSIREIRLSERKFYQKITDLYATAFDYDKDAKTTRRFFQTVQNRQSSTQKQNLKSIGLCRIECSYLIMISFCWNLKNKQKTNLIEYKSQLLHILQ